VSTCFSTGSDMALKIRVFDSDRERRSIRHSLIRRDAIDVDRIQDIFGDATDMNTYCHHVGRMNRHVQALSERFAILSFSAYFCCSESERKRQRHASFDECLADTKTSYCIYVFGILRRF
jgi:hypothetical protein